MAFPQEKRFRLRNGEQIAGFMRQLDGDMIFYSRDAHWWTGHKIKYRQIDEWTGLYDRNRIAVYEWDILKFKIDPDGEYVNGVVLWEQIHEQFVIRKVDEDIYFPLEAHGMQLFDQNQLEVFSYLFINPDLIDELGLNDD